MTRTFLRLIVGLVGGLALLLAARIWISPATAVAQLGVGALSPLGTATLRADFGGFFAVAGGLALAAAIRNERRLLTGPLALAGLALIGRCATALDDGLVHPMILPMVVEAVLVVVFALGRRGLGQRGA